MPERFVGLVDAVDQVQHLQREIDDERVEQVLRDRVDAVHVDRLLRHLHHRHVEQHHRRDPDTIAENRNTIGISGVDHHGFALIEPKMKPT